MFKKLLILVTLVAVAHGKPKTKAIKTISPRTLYDQALKELENLRQVVESAIVTAENDLQAARSEYEAYGGEVASEAETDISNEAARIDGLIADVVAIIETPVYNYCIRGQENYPQDLSREVIRDLTRCIDAAIDKVDGEVYSATDVIRNSNKTVDDLSKKLDNCVTGAILCVSPIITSIEAAVIEIPGTIEKADRTAVDNIEALKSQVDECQNIQVTTYVSEATDFLNDINDCVNAW